MSRVVIENPILNSPFREPTQHFKFSDDGITDEIAAGRRSSSYFIPIPRAKSKTRQQMALEGEWTKERIEENRFINDIRRQVAIWRMGGYQGITSTTRRLLEYWKNDERERRLFFCQIEALETAIYINEVAGRQTGDAWIENQLRQANQSSNPLLDRIALKMATGSGKTVVVAMLIAWLALNKLANTQDRRFSDAFLVVSPGIIIRDRLRVLLPNDPQNYNRQLDLLNLIVEVSGQAKLDKAAKERTARNIWIPAVNNHGGFGRWAFVEVTDPWDAEATVQAIASPTEMKVA